MACPKLVKIELNSPNNTRAVGDRLTFRIITNGGGLHGGGLPKECRDKLSRTVTVKCNGSIIPVLRKGDYTFFLAAKPGIYRGDAVVQQPGNPETFRASKSLKVPS